MASNKAYYWLALGVLVLGINSEYQRGRLQPLHRMVDSSVATVNCVAASAQQYLAVAKVLFGGAPSQPAGEAWAQVRELGREGRDVARIGREMARHQVEFAKVNRGELSRLGAEMARHQAEFARLQAQRARMAVMATKGRKSIVCNDAGLRVMVDSSDGTDIDVDIADTF